MSMKPLRVALYARCSTNEDKQDTDTQLLQLRESADRRGWQVVSEYVDYASGGKSRKQRPQFDQMLKDASQRRFDVLYFWRLDRFSREGIEKTIHYLKLLDGWGVKFKSHTEEYLDTDNELISHILLGVLSYFAKLQREQISENTKAGIERARKQGKRIGRAPLPDKIRQQIIETYAELQSIRKTSAALKQSHGTVQRVIAEYKGG